MKWILIYSLITVIPFIGLYFYLRYRKQKGWWNKTPFLKTFPLPLANSYTSPKGVRVNSQLPMPDAKLAIFDAIESGISDYFRSTENKNFVNNRLHSDFEICMLSDWVLDSYGKPALKIKLLDAWKNTDYDKGGYMLVAGMVLGLADRLFSKPLVFIPQTSDLAFLRVICRFEPEHIGAQEDWVLAQETSGQHYHPIFPLPEEQARGAYAPAQVEFGCCTLTALLTK